MRIPIFSDPTYWRNKQMRSTSYIALLLALALSFLSGCGSGQTASPSPTPSATPPAVGSGTSGTPQTPSQTPPASGTLPPTSAANSGTAPSAISGTGSSAKPDTKSGSASGNDKAIPAVPPANQTAAKPESITVLVNKQVALPESYEPKDLVYPDVPFTFSDKVEKRKMRKEAADALKQLFDGAKKDSIFLAGVSAYRSYSTQKTLFNRYVQTDGEEKAKMYSAVPGHSEHETGLAIDVSGSNGKCAAENCFAATKEAKWLDQHAPEFGFIIRYPKGKESITGYQYEPWHLRYVGTGLSKELAAKGLTLEEYFNAIPVTR
jgi:D-alanyl-D-alanine carboxypeptidase